MISILILLYKTLQTQLLILNVWGQLGALLKAVCWIWSEMSERSFTNYFLGEEHFISMFLHFVFEWLC